AQDGDLRLDLTHPELVLAQEALELVAQLPGLIDRVLGDVNGRHAADGTCSGSEPPVGSRRADAGAAGARRERRSSARGQEDAGAESCAGAEVLFSGAREQVEDGCRGHWASTEGAFTLER